MTDRVESDTERVLWGLIIPILAGAFLLWGLSRVTVGGEMTGPESVEPIKELGESHEF